MTVDGDAAQPTVPPRGRRWWVWVLVVVVVAVVAGITGWAVATVLRPAEDPTTATKYTYATVQSGQVGSSIALNTVASWSTTPVASNAAAGVVTSVGVKPGAVVTMGTTLYTVDLRPTVAAQGSVPAFRAIGPGDHGADVAQVQRMLKTLGFYSGPADGKAGPGTVAAIRAWQKSTGVATDGTVRLGDVVFLPTLPTRVALDGEVIARGKTVTGGETAIGALPASPSFTVPVAQGQAALMPSGTPVQITAPKGGTWNAVVDSQKPDPQSNSVNVTLAATGKAPICGNDCDQVPVTGDTLLASKIVTAPTVTGLVVPTAALTTTADGQTVLIDKAGAQHPVTVTATAQGMSVIEGVDEGFRARVPATADEK
ncbi:peptidoglycan-binding protein [Microbacterium luticocti]|uniref:peptidoglycan-binding protein n=1 Tax=Microbacterium luticocti TaxID=451764 RepID=UPI00040B1005|nr:peptidoglycan-binding protein [Microbacterium luticocti]